MPTDPPVTGIGPDKWPIPVPKPKIDYRVKYVKLKGSAEHWHLKFYYDMPPIIPRVGEVIAATDSDYASAYLSGKVESIRYVIDGAAGENSKVTVIVAVKDDGTSKP